VELHPDHAAVLEHHAGEVTADHQAVDEPASSEMTTKHRDRIEAASVQFDERGVDAWMLPRDPCVLELGLVGEDDGNRRQLPCQVRRCPALSWRVHRATVRQQPLAASLRMSPSEATSFGPPVLPTRPFRPRFGLSGHRNIWAPDR
jgi:hypothetical protein